MRLARRSLATPRFIVEPIKALLPKKVMPALDSAYGGSWYDINPSCLLCGEGIDIFSIVSGNAKLGSELAGARLTEIAVGAGGGLRGSRCMVASPAMVSGRGAVSGAVRPDGDAPVLLGIERIGPRRLVMQGTNQQLDGLQCSATTA